MMKTIIFVLVSFIICLRLDAQTSDSWMRKADFGGHSRSFSVGFSVDSFGYIGCFGSDRSDTFPYAQTSYSDLWQYNPRTDIWIQKANFPGAIRDGGICFVIGSKVYVGLADAPYQMSDFWEYDSYLDTWTRKGDFPGGPRSGAIGFSIDNKGYVGLGKEDNSGFLHDVWQYDPSNDSWVQMRDFTGGGRQNAISFSINDTGYIGLGFYSTHFQTDFWQYLPSTDTWVQKADFPSISTQGTSHFVIGNSAYICAGRDSNSDTHGDFWKYDPALNLWTQKDSFGGVARSYAAGFSIKNAGYIGTGLPRGSYLASIKDFWQYNPDSIYTGIHDLDMNAFSISPNPATERLTITTSLHDLSISVSDMTGRSYAVVNTDRDIDISALSAGVYMLRLQSSDGSTVRRFVKE